jgi:hypothetical protein
MVQDKEDGLHHEHHHDQHDGQDGQVSQSKLVLLIIFGLFDKTCFHCLFAAPNLQTLQDDTRAVVIMRMLYVI